MQKSLPKIPKKPKKSKRTKTMSFSQKYKMFQYTIVVEKYLLILVFCFWPFFVTKNFTFVLFHSFMHKSLPKTSKKPKIQKISKIMRFFTKVKNLSTCNLGSQNMFLIFWFCFWPVFVTKNCIAVFFSQFYAQILNKKPKTTHNLILYKTRKKKKTTLRKNSLQILILFFIKPERK